MSGIAPYHLMPLALHDVTCFQGYKSKWCNSHFCVATQR